MTEDNEERIVTALEIMSNALNAMARTYELLYYKMYPPSRQKRDIFVTHPESEDERLRRDQGATGEKTTEEWMELDGEPILGPREREFVERERRDRGGEERAGEARKGPGQDPGGSGKAPA